MEQKDIIINGVSINELKKQRNSIRQGAAKIISENLEIAKELTQKLVESTDKVEINSLAKEAYEALDNANVVAGVSGVSFLLPFYEESGSYESKEIFSTLLEESDNEILKEVWDDSLNQLYNLFYTMETQSRDWHSSRC